MADYGLAIWIILGVLIVLGGCFVWRILSDLGLVHRELMAIEPQTAKIDELVSQQKEFNFHQTKFDSQQKGFETRQASFESELATVAGAAREATGIIRSAGQLASGLGETLKSFKEESKNLVSIAEQSEQTKLELNRIKQQIEILSARQINEQFNKYPRRVRFADADKYGVSAIPRQDEYLTFNFTAKRLSVQLICERHYCVHKTEEGDGLGYTGPIYELPAEVSFAATICFDRVKTKVERFFEALEITQVVPKGEHAAEQYIHEHLDSVAGLLGVKVAVAMKAMAAPVFVTGLVLVKAGLSNVVERLKVNQRDVEATKLVHDMIVSEPYNILDLGGPGHVQFGEWIRKQEKEKGKHIDGVFGGLTRWVDPDTDQFAWLCPDCAYALIARYKRPDTRPNPYQTRSANAGG